MFEDFSEEGLAKIRHFANQELNPIVYLAIDPGKSNGVCGYDTKCYTQFMLTVPSENMIEFLDQFEMVGTCIVEKYEVYPNKLKDHVYSDMETSRVIGRIESWAKKHGTDLVMQKASVKPTGYAWLGKKPLPKSNPMNHPMDAHVHFTYWAVRKELISPTQLLKQE